MKDKNSLPMNQDLSNLLRIKKEKVDASKETKQKCKSKKLKNSGKRKSTPLTESTEQPPIKKKLKPKFSDPKEKNKENSCVKTNADDFCFFNKAKKQNQLHEEESTDVINNISEEYKQTEYNGLDTFQLLEENLAAKGGVKNDATEKENEKINQQEKEIEKGAEKFELLEENRAAKDGVKNDATEKENEKINHQEKEIEKGTEKIEKMNQHEEEIEKATAIIDQNETKKCDKQLCNDEEENPSSEATKKKDIVLDIQNTSNCNFSDTYDQTVPKKVKKGSSKKKSKSKNKDENYKEMKKFNEMLKGQVKDLLKENEEYKVLLQIEKDENTKLRSRNDDLQRKVIDKMEEYAGRKFNPFDVVARSERTVGFIKNDGTIHCGNDIYIPLTIYDNAKNKAARSGKQTSHFVKEIAISIIGIEDMKRCSVSGRGCNRTKTDAKPAVNPIRLGAVYSIFEYYLKTEKDYDPVKIAGELEQVGKWVSQKMWDLIRPPRKTKSVTKTTPIPKKSNLVEKNCTKENGTKDSSDSSAESSSSSTSEDDSESDAN